VAVCPVEVVAAGGVHRRRVRLESDDRHSEWFPWASVGRDAIDRLAATAGLVVHESWKEHGRCFVALQRN
jgi:hypothetical protein